MSQWGIIPGKRESDIEIAWPTLKWRITPCDFSLRGRDARPARLYHLRICTIMCT